MKLTEEILTVFLFVKLCPVLYWRMSLLSDGYQLWLAGWLAGRPSTTEKRCPARLPGVPGVSSSEKEHNTTQHLNNHTHSFELDKNTSFLLSLPFLEFHRLDLLIDSII